MAYPPVSGGELGCYTILLTQMGLPVELLAFMCTISLLLDFLEAPANTLATELQLLNIDRKLKETYKSQKTPSPMVSQWFDPKREYRYNIVEENKKGEKTWHI